MLQYSELANQSDCLKRQACEIHSHALTHFCESTVWDGNMTKIIELADSAETMAETETELSESEAENKP